MTQFAGCAAVCCVPWDTALGELGEQQHKRTIVCARSFAVVVVVCARRAACNCCAFFPKWPSKAFVVVLFSERGEGGRGGCERVGV